MEEEVTLKLNMLSKNKIKIPINNLKANKKLRKIKKKMILFLLSVKPIYSSVNLL